MRKERGIWIYLIGLLLFLFMPPLLPKAWTMFILAASLALFSLALDLLQRWVYTVKLALLLLLLASTLLKQHTGVEGWMVVSYVIFVLVFAINIYQMVYKLVTATDPSNGFIVAGVNAYLLLGYFFGVLCAGCQYLVPGSFAGNAPLSYDHLQSFIYYAFVTMATLGYGDILPQSAAGRGLAVIIMVSGTFYVTLVIGLLISNRRANQPLKENS